MKPYEFQPIVIPDPLTPEQFEAKLAKLIFTMRMKSMELECTSND